MRVDAHHHLWRYTAEEFDWIDESMAVLRRDFLVADLEQVMAEAGIEATVVVQARQTLAETRWLLNTAAHGSLIRGVVGWLPIAEEGFAEQLAEFAANPLLKGLRHVVQAEPAGFLDRPDFNRGIAAMRETKLVYDLLVVEAQLPETVRFVDRHPEQKFVVDHFAKPRPGGPSFEAWARGIRALAEREGVLLKVSGLVTEAEGYRWTPEALRPYWDTVVEAFGPGRLMFGSDWPVLTVACSYADWAGVVAGWVEELSESERNAIEGDVAARCYRLATP